MDPKHSQTHKNTDVKIDQIFGTRGDRGAGAPLPTAHEAAPFQAAEYMSSCPEGPEGTESAVILPNGT